MQLRGEAAHPAAVRPRTDGAAGGRRIARALARFDATPGEGPIVVLDIEGVQTSCGFAVPRDEFQGHRPTLAEWSERQGSARMEQYRLDKNRVSIDGLPTRLAKT